MKRILVGLIVFTGCASTPPTQDYTPLFKRDVQSCTRHYTHEYRDAKRVKYEALKQPMPKHTEREAMPEFYIEQCVSEVRGQK